jgi:indolepyruvate ferredoxin oxidoreductase
MGDSIYANVLLLGFAWQCGLVPVGGAALQRAIELNGVKVNDNKLAFAWGRLAAVDPARIDALTGIREDAVDTSLADIVARRTAFLTDYQDSKLAARYTALVERVRDAETRIHAGEELATTVARSYFKLLAYKDEYEVARLHTQSGFLESVRKDFGQKGKIRFHLAPPILNRKRDARGRPVKKAFGSWIVPALRLLARMRGLRGTAFDMFGYAAERRMERALQAEFEQTVRELLAGLSAGSIDEATDIVSLYMNIRGFGPVKEQAVKDVRGRVAERLASMRG